MFLLFQLDDSVGFICPATSETAFSQEKIVNVGNTIFDVALTTNQVYVLTDPDQLDRLRGTILESQTLEAPSWNLLSCFSVDLSTEQNKTMENRNFAKVNSHTFERQQEQRQRPEKGFEVLLCIPNHRLSEISSSQTEEGTKEQLTTELKYFSSVLYEAYSLRLESGIPSVGQVRRSGTKPVQEVFMLALLLLSDSLCILDLLKIKIIVFRFRQQLNNNFPASSVVNQSSDALIKKMMDRIQCVLSYDK
ncbi:hypothetical protein AHF37_01437 [Paragonimus kellicotti]|nr:hypothetical protein AHF37_01437 [Paragonimus kellicotti]